MTGEPPVAGVGEILVAVNTYQLRTAADGRFEFRLPPGRFLVTGDPIRPQLLVPGPDGHSPWRSVSTHRRRQPKRLTRVTAVELPSSGDPASPEVVSGSPSSSSSMFQALKQCRSRLNIPDGLDIHGVNDRLVA